MHVAIIQLCVDPRLNHQLIRIQVDQKLTSLDLKVDSIILVNEIGGNFGQNFINTLDLFLKQGAEVLLCGVLHHDDCVAAKHKLRQSLEDATAKMRALLGDAGIACPVWEGKITTETNHLEWSS